MRKKVAFIGIGNRGYIYAGLVKKREDAEVAAICDADENSLRIAGEMLGVPREKCFLSSEEFFAQGKLADAAVISTPDKFHFEHCMKALAAGYDVLLEKPIAATEEECLKIGEKAAACGRKVVICHVLRYTPFYRTIKRIIDSGSIGRVIHISQSENVGFWHYTQSFVRGKWKNSEESNPMILAKCCHDLDIINWLIGDTCVSVSSYGSLSYFTEENAPPQSAECCCDCKLQNCLYNAVKRSKEMKGTMNVPYGFDYSDVSIENYLRDKSNDYGRCVFRSGNNVVDHQSVAMNFRNGATATLNMHTFAEETYRSTKVIGTRGEIIGRFGERNDDSITVNVIAPLDEFKPEIIEVGTGETGHGGGDGGLIDSFFDYVFYGKKSADITDLDVSIASHLMGYAAEYSRLHDGASVRIK